MATGAFDSLDDTTKKRYIDLALSGKYSELSQTIANNKDIDDSEASNVFAHAVIAAQAQEGIF